MLSSFLKFYQLFDWDYEVVFYNEIQDAKKNEIWCSSSVYTDKKVGGSSMRPHGFAKGTLHRYFGKELQKAE